MNLRVKSLLCYSLGSASSILPFQEENMPVGYFPVPLHLPSLFQELLYPLLLPRPQGGRRLRRELLQANLYA